MINTVYFAIGFIIYVWYSKYSFDLYSKKEGFSKFFIFLLIYIIYTSLAGYVINFVDINSPLIERLVQILIYAIVGGVLIYVHYESKIMKKLDPYK